MSNIDTTHEPPTAEEMLSYLHGELSPEEERRFRSRLVGYPELVRTLVAPFPEPAQPGDDDYLSEAEFTRRWPDFQKRAEPARRVVPLWPAVAALAAAVAVTFASLYWHARNEQRIPHVLSADLQALFPDGTARGGEGEAITVRPAGEAYALMPVLADERAFDRYRVELFDMRHRSIWSRSGVPRSANGTLLILIPRSFLAPGVYHLSIYASAGEREEHVNDYTVRLAP